METSCDLSVRGFSVQIIKGSGRGFLAGEEPSLLGTLRDESPVVGYPSHKIQPYQEEGSRL